VGDVQPLPRFTHPPVVETVLGVYFRPIKEFTVAHQGALWDRCFRQRFPKLEERAPVEEAREVFGDELTAAPLIRWQISDRPSSPRLWASSEDGQHILQIQRNAVLTNWLKTEDVTKYLSYDRRSECFATDLRQVDHYLKSEGIGEITPTTCLVTYVNHIDCDDPSQLSPVLAATLSFWQSRTSDGWLPDPDKLNLQFGFPFPDRSGRLSVHIAPAVQRSGKQHLLRMDLTARGTPKSRELATAMNWLDLGHEWVVRGFASMTNLDSHKRWGRTQ
jgi:uncharacterized protein (TIGR04255 family)